MTADEILSIPKNRPELLFTMGGVESEYRALVKQWHPDVSTSPRAAEVTSHLNELKREASTKISLGTWDKPGTLITRGKDGKTRIINYRRKRAFELGHVYYGSHGCSWVLDKQHKGLFARGEASIISLGFANDQMRENIGPYLPRIKASFQTEDGRRVMVLNKPEGVYSIRDVMESRPGGFLEPEHAAWITSCCLNLACYMEWMHVSHGDFSIDSCFVSPEKHSVYLLGGWWYATGIGQILTHLPTRTYRLAPRDTLASKMADNATDLLLIRAMGREMTGMDSGKGDQVPEPMREFYRFPPTGTALEDYKLWRDSILPASFGARRFVELRVKESDVFKETT